MLHMNITESITRIFSKMFYENIKSFCINSVNYSMYTIYILFFSDDDTCLLMDEYGTAYASIKHSGKNAYDLDINGMFISNYQFIKTIHSFICNYMKEQDFKLNDVTLEFDSITDLLLYYSDCIYNFNEEGDDYYIDVTTDTLIESKLNIRISATDLQY